MKPYIKFVAALFHGWDITLSSCLAVSWPDILFVLINCGTLSHQAGIAGGGLLGYVAKKICSCCLNFQEQRLYGVRWRKTDLTRAVANLFGRKYFLVCRWIWLCWFPIALLRRLDRKYLQGVMGNIGNVLNCLQYPKLK